MTKPLLAFSFVCISCFAFSQAGKTYGGKYDEPYRPAFHFTPQTGWMNDPNGLVFLNGKYHLFFQYYPDDIVWGPMHWGHAVSADLIHWQHLPIALFPDSSGWIFSGSAVIDKDNTAGFGKNAMVAVFTYHSDARWKKGFKNTENQALAYSNDEGKTWIKYKGNPVLQNAGEQDFRDPKVFWNDEIKRWNLVLAAGNIIKIFSSPDLKNWQHESDYTPSVQGDFGVWECPDLFKMKVGREEKWILMISQTMNAPNGGVGNRYFVGDFNGKVFSNVEGGDWLDYGKDFYAAATFNNVNENKRILIAWMSNWQYADKTPASVWRCSMTLPRSMTLIKTNGRYYLKQEIVKQFQSLTTNFNSTKQVSTPFKASGNNLSQAEISFAIDSTTSNLTIEVSNVAGESFTIDMNGKQLMIDRTKSGNTGFSDKFAAEPQSMPLQEKIYHFQIILDKSSVEVLVNNGRYSMTNQLFPEHNYTDISISGVGNTAIKNLQINEVRSCWID